MDFKEYLVSKGIEESKVNEIVEGMPAQKLYLTDEENLKPRFDKLKAQKEQQDAELANATKLVADLQKSVKDNEDATAKIAQYQQEAEQAKTKQAEIEKTYALKDALREAGAKDIEYMMFKLGDVDMDDKGAIIDLDNKIKSLKESNVDWFAGDEQATEQQSGFEVIDNKLETGMAGTAEETAIKAFEQAVGIQNK